MQSSRRVQSFMEPIPQGKRARLEGAMGTAAPPGLSTADSLTPYSQDKSLAYRHHYLPCPLSRQDITSWSPTRILVRNGGSPVIHPSSTSGSITNPVFYRPENVTFPVDSCSSTEAEDLAAKHTFSYCTRSPSEHSSAGLVSSVAFKKIPISCTSVSPSATENSVGIAIPKPVYGHSPYCSEQKCTLGHNYAKERGLQRVPPQILETDLMAYHDHWAYLNKKESETLMLQRHLSFDQCREGALLKDAVTGGYYGFTPARPTPISAFSKPSPVSSFVTSTPESSQHFQIPTQTHKDLTPMYEALTGVQYGGQLRVYQDCPLLSKYGAIAQHSRLSCPKNNTNAYRPENYLITDKQTGPFHIHQPYFGDLPNPLTRLSPGHLGVSNVPAYTTYRMPRNTSTVDTITKTPFCLHVMQQGDRPLDFSMRREPTADSYKTSGGQSCHETESQVHLRAHAVSNNAENTNSNVLQDHGQDCWPISSHDHTNSPRCTDKIVNEKQSVNDSGKSDDAALSSKGHREGTGSTETDSLGKAHKMDKQKSNDLYLPSSPQMPVINSVFSLAPYKAYLEAAGVLSSAGNSECIKLEPDSEPTKEDQKTQNTAEKPNLAQDELHLEAVKKPTACNHGSNDETLIKFKKEDISYQGFISYQSEINKSPSPVFCHKDDSNIKEHTDFEDKVDAQHNHVIKNGFEQECKPLTPEIPDQSSQHNHKCSVLDKIESVPPDKDSDPPGSLSSTPPIIPEATVSISKIPQHCLKLTSYKIVLPEDLKTSLVPEFHQSPVEVKPKVSSRQARHKFMELHQSLCRLVTDSIFHSTHCELRNWLSRLDLAKPVSPPVKTQKVSCLLGSKAREVWMKGEETVTALQNVLCQLERYLKNHECPFPHVIRAGAVFIPMLVVKEILFPQVQGTFVDQVLQEHRVELRPTTLSEERQLTQLHKRAFSSKLRRLLSLKYLTDIYPDVLTLLYYASVSKFLGEVEVNIAFKKESVECLDDPEGSDKVLKISPRPFTPDGSTYRENLEQNSCHKRYKSKGRVKSVCRRMFLGEATSPAEEEHESEIWSCADLLGGEGWEHIPVACSNEEGHIEVRIKEDTKQESEDFWGQPLTTDDLSSESTDMETEMESWSLRPSCSSGNTERPSFSKSHSDMVLKLRKVCYNRDSQGQVSHYQRVPEQSKAHRGGGKHKGRHRKKKNRGSEPTMQRTHTSAKSKHSVHPPTHCASKQKRWLLRSAVQNAHRSMRKSYPDLLGKRIRHLYEETDKTEVWYKGVVVRIHEPHPNPLKTVFEVKYDSEPEWQYYLELLMDYKKGWLQIED